MSSSDSRPGNGRSFGSYKIKTYGATLADFRFVSFRLFRRLALDRQSGDCALRLESALLDIEMLPSALPRVA